MNKRGSLISLFLPALLSCYLFSQSSKPPLSPSLSIEGASPEMEKLARAFVGEWDTTESMEHSEYFPHGGGRSGKSHWRLGVGGTTLIAEGNSDGSVGPLSYLITIWWDKKSKTYGFFTCFKDTGSSCRVRGTAHWEGDTFVNDYEEMENGKSIKWRDSFTQI